MSVQFYSKCGEMLSSLTRYVCAWQSIVEDQDQEEDVPEGPREGRLALSRDEATTLIAASLIYTIKKYGPDRIFGFTPIPAMSMVGYSSGARFISLIGGAMCSFYDWYSDLPPASPQVWGKQTMSLRARTGTKPVTSLFGGRTSPMTRTPDAHFYSEGRLRRGTRTAAVAPDYAEYVKFADTWLPAKAGTDSALAMAMTFVILKEFYIDRQSDYFASYAKAFTDLPFAVILKQQGDQFVSDRFLRASDLGLSLNNAEWKTVYFDANSRKFVVPNGSIGFRWNEEGRWNLRAQDSMNGSDADPLLSFGEDDEGWVTVGFPLFEFDGPKVKLGAVPVKNSAVGTVRFL